MAISIVVLPSGVTITGITSNFGPTFTLIYGGVHLVGCSDTGTAAGTLEYQAPDGSYVPVTNGTFTAAGALQLYLAPGNYFWQPGAGITLGSFFATRMVL
jgi:hypothetical protein